MVEFNFDEYKYGSKAVAKKYKQELEDKIAAMIKDTYASDGYEDEGRSTQAAHEIIGIL